MPFFFFPFHLIVSPLRSFIALCVRVLCYPPTSLGSITRCSLTAHMLLLALQAHSDHHSFNVFPVVFSSFFRHFPCPSAHGRTFLRLHDMDSESRGENGAQGVSRPRLASVPSRAEDAVDQLQENEKLIAGKFV